MKKIILPVALAAVMVTSGLAIAVPPSGKAGPGPRNCPVIDQLSPAQQQELSGVMRDYGPKLGELNDRIRVKHWELNALSRNPNATEKSISEASKELETLMSERRALLSERGAKLEKIAGQPLFMGGMYGHRGNWDGWHGPRGRHHGPDGWHDGNGCWGPGQRY